MTTIDARLKAESIKILRSAIGKTLDSIEHDEFISSNISSQAVRFNMRGKTFYLYSFTRPLDYYGTEENVAVWSIENTAHPLTGHKHFVKTLFREIITGIRVIQENQMLFDNDRQTYDVWVTRGIIFEFADFELSFEKPVWFSEELIIHVGHELLEEFQSTDVISRNENWNEGIRMVCRREIVPLYAPF